MKYILVKNTCVEFEIIFLDLKISVRNYKTRHKQIEGNFVLIRSVY